MANPIEGVDFLKFKVDDVSKIYIPKATATTLGVVLSSGGEGAFSPITGFQAGFASADSPPLGVASSRAVGTSAQLAGAIKGPAAGKAEASPIAQLPATQWPASVRVVGVSVLLSVSGSGLDTAAANYILIDNAAGVFSGTPGLMILGVAVPATDSGFTIWLDGLSYYLL